MSHTLEVWALFLSMAAFAEREEVEAYGRTCSFTCWAGVCTSGDSEGVTLVGGSASRTVVGLPFTPKGVWKDQPPLTIMCLLLS